MRKLVANTFVSLDGVMQAPGGPEEDPSGEFEHGGWSVSYWDEMMGEVMDSYSRREYDLLLGRKTYELFAAHWPYVEAGEDPTADRINSAVKYVVSNTLSDPTWARTEVLSGDIPDKVRELKAGDGPEIQVQGSSALLQTLLENDLIDEFQVWVFPVLLGEGKRLFGPTTAPGGLELVDSKQSTTGVLISTYRRSGEVPIGSFAFEEPTDAEMQRREKQTG